MARHAFQEIDSQLCYSTMYALRGHADSVISDWNFLSIIGPEGIDITSGSYITAVHANACGKTFIPWRFQE